VLSGGNRRGSREEEDARRKDRKEGSQRPTEDRSERIESSRLGLRRSRLYRDRLRSTERLEFRRRSL